MMKFVLFGLTILSFSVSAQQKTLIKCHISVLGNADTIHHVNAMGKTPSQIGEELYGRDILTTLSPRKLKVYKVHECLNADKDFSKGKARLLERNLAQ